jgi:hypothetical protein
MPIANMFDSWCSLTILYILLLAAQHVRQLVFTHKLGQRQASVVLAARVVEVRMVKNILAAQHVRQLVFTHRLGQRQASVVLAARVVEVRMVKNS